jgi:hypothetical protein
MAKEASGTARKKRLAKDSWKNSQQKTARSSLAGGRNSREASSEKVVSKDSEHKIANKGTNRVTEHASLEIIASVAGTAGGCKNRQPLFCTHGLDGLALPQPAKMARE